MKTTIMEHGAGGAERSSSRPAASSPALSPACSEAASGGFSLVEVVIAIGIFAFVIVGIIGLFPAALRIRSDSALDTRAAMIAQQLISAVDTSTSLSNVAVPTGTYSGSPATRTVNLLQANFPTVLGFQAKSTLPYWYYRLNPNSSWTNANSSDGEIAESAQNQISTLARITATTNGLSNNLAQITIEVRSPAPLALSNSRVVTFTTLRPLQ